MPHYIAERLRAEDASYLLFESPNAHMHLSWVWIFEGGTLTHADGGIDIDAIRRHVAARLFRFPRFRQRLVWTPLEGHPAWVDDESFKLRYHVQHAALPDPGDEARLQMMAASVVSQPLDRSKPLWELWVVEGLPDRRFAVVSKTHHCMMDGRSTVGLMNGLLDARPLARPEEPPDWIARPAPGPEALLRDGLVERVRQAVHAARDSGQWLMDPDAWRQAFDVGNEVFRAALAPPPATPFNRPIGPHRLANWLRVPLGPLERASAQLGCTVQELALAAVAGAMTRLLARTGTRVPGDELRVVVPVTAPADGDPTVHGNRTDAGVLSLPVAERDVRRRVRAIGRGMAEARRESGGLHNLDFLLRVAGIGGRSLLGLGLAARRRLYGCNLVVSDIPGPAEPMHLLDARLVAAYPLVPLLDDQGLGIAFSAYDGAYHAGLAADWEIVPDLEAVTQDLRAEFDELCRAGGAIQRVEPPRAHP
jgi:diacylglycerol O-acyltransferase / wax synthase